MKRPLRIVITAGPTREPIDPARYISNRSTGYMGAQLATQALARGHRVCVISGPSVEPMPLAARVIPVETAKDMERALRAQAKRADVVIMAAAVSDFKPSHATRVKLPRRETLVLHLEATPDIIGRLPRRARQLVVGFALESRRVLRNASAKLRAKQLDLLLAQELNGFSAPFGRCRVKAWLLEHSGKARWLGVRSKEQVARTLLDKVETLWYGQQRRTGQSAHEKA
jgi:phosphopantothenoylcysteine decarboxylase/phosphopantothenate--cysteine ligase